MGGGQCTNDDDDNNNDDDGDDDDDDDEPNVTQRRIPLFPDDEEGMTGHNIRCFKSPCPIPS